MKCHYEVLGVTRNATYDDVKAAYRRLALTWHPDKNLANPEEAKKQFQRIKQAWDVLSDSHERTWYDNHREAILKGSTEDYKDESLNLFPYFSTMCFEGYGDDENGFYAVYRNVFMKIAEEDAEFADESEAQMPSFGNSQSSYEGEVHNFYAYWQSYSTKRSFAWLNPYDLRSATNRRVFRLAEKENRKVRDKARRERNEQVRNLVAYVRKRDKRVQAHAAKLAERARENARKVEERKKAQVLERQKLLREQKNTESEWSKFSNIEAELRKIEATLSDDSDDGSVDDDNTLYCIVCNKVFKTHKAYMNHENSRKHKENFNALEATLAQENEELLNSDVQFQDVDSPSTESAAPNEPKLATDSQMPDFLLNSEDDTREHDDEDDGDTSDDELNSGDEESSKDCQSTASNEVKLATNSQMPDFLINPPENDTKELGNDDTSHDELISDDEEDPKNNQSANKKKKINVDVPLAEGSRMNYNCFLYLSESDKEDQATTSRNDQISDQEGTAAWDCQKKKKKSRRRRKKTNVQNLNPAQDRTNDDDDTESINEEVRPKSKKQRKKLQQRKASTTKQEKNNARPRDGEKREAEGKSKSTEAKSDDMNETASSKRRSKKDESVTKSGNDTMPQDFVQLLLKENRDNAQVWREENNVYNMEMSMDIGSISPTLVQVGSFQ